MPSQSADRYAAIDADQARITPLSCKQHWRDHSGGYSASEMRRCADWPKRPMCLRSWIGCVKSGFGRTVCAICGPMLSGSCFSSRSTKRCDEERYLDEAEGLVAEVNRVLGRPRGIRIGEEPDRDGQYFHYLAMWLYALAVLGRHRPAYREQGVALARQIHDPFVVPGRGVIWKMQEDLSGPYPGYGFGALDAFDGYVSYRLLDERALSREIAEMRSLIERDRQRSRHYPGSRPRHDALACPFLPRGRLGQAAHGAFAFDARQDVARAGLFRARAISAACPLRFH